MTQKHGMTLQALEAVTCQCGGEDCDNRTIFFHGRCHPESGTWASYTKGEGKLVIKCKECDTLIAEVAVASVH